MKRRQLLVMNVLTCVIMLGCGRNRDLATDKELIEAFRANRAEFESLAALLSADPAATRTEECRNRLAALGVTQVTPSSRADGKSLYLWMSGSGYAVHSSYKGILWTKEGNVTPLVSELGGESIPLHSVAFRQIADGWYLWLRRD